MVRPLQDDCAASGGAFNRAERQGEDRQAQYRREPADDDPLRGALDPDADPVQERGAGGHEGWGWAEERPAEVDPERRRVAAFLSICLCRHARTDPGLRSVTFQPIATVWKWIAGPDPGSSPGRR